MLDVHPPHERMHGWRDFLLHLLTITIGLLIALGLEGCVEWQHHRHLVHEAERSLDSEIRTNAKGLLDFSTQLKRHQVSLAHDVKLLQVAAKTGHYPTDERLEIGFGFQGFDNVSWRTAQATGAFSYMSYATAQEFSDIYNTQDELNAAEHTAVRDTVECVALFADSKPDSAPPGPAEAKVVIGRIGVLQGQLMLVDSLAKDLNAQYQKFLDAHR